jgi:hypothetical protein
MGKPPLSGETEGTTAKIRHHYDKWRKTLGEVLYGLTTYELEVQRRKDRGELDNLLMLIVFGDLVGLPIFPPYYSMRLLPYIVPRYKTWRRNILREKDITDILSTDLS